jgi:hypothetical protein
MADGKIFGALFGANKDKSTSATTGGTDTSGGGDMGSIGGGSVVLGAGQMLMGAINRKKADAMLPPSENPMERQMLNSIRRRRQALMTGTASSGDRANVRQMAKSMGQNAFRAGGPVNTGVLSQLMNQGMANISNQYGQEIAQNMAMEQKQVKDITDFRNDVAFLKANKKSAQAEQQMKSGFQNVAASMPSKEEMAGIAKVLMGNPA